MGAFTQLLLPTLDEPDKATLMPREDHGSRNTGSSVSERKEESMTAPPSSHHRHSPSQLEMYEACPCYAPDNTRDTTAADEGTLMHEAAETGDLSKLETEEQVETVNRALTLKASIVELYDDPVVEVEKKVSVLDLTKGTLDLVVHNKKSEAHMLDWKFGRNKVTEAIDNGQVQAYVAGLFEEYPWLQTIHATLAFPRLDWTTSHTYTRDDLDKIRLRIATIVDRCGSDSREPHPTEKGCMYCGNKASCPALHTFALRVGETLPVPVQFDPGKLVDPREMAKVLVLSKLLEDWAKQVRRTLTAAAVEEGTDIPGFEIRSRQGSYEVTEVYDAIQLLLDKFDVDLAMLTQACKVSIPKLTDIIAAVSEGTKKDVRGKLLDVLEPCIVQNETVTFLQKKRGVKNEEIIQG